MKRMFLAPVIGAFVLTVAAPVSAQWGSPTVRRPSERYGSGNSMRQVGYDNGYREGVTEGEKDGRSGDAYRFEDERDFQRADEGYRNSYGSREMYRQSFKTGFADGYSEGYRRYARGGYGYGRYGRNDGYGGYGSDTPRYGTYGQRGYYSVGFDNGWRDGVEKGREDIRKNRSFDARRHEWYREGDRHYDDDYGSRDQYKIQYRNGFNAGYEQGYRYGY